MNHTQPHPPRRTLRRPLNVHATAPDRLPGSEELPEPDTRDVEETVEPATTSAALDLAISYPVPTVCVVKAVGDLDMLTVPTIADCVGEQVVAGPVHLVIDLAAVTFLGSAGTGTLLECSRWLEATVPGSTLHLSGTHRRNIHRPLELVGLLPLFNAPATLPEALTQLGARPGTPPVSPYRAE